MKFKLVKKSKNKIRCVRDPKTELEVCPSDIGLSDTLNDSNLQLLEFALEAALTPDKKPHLFDMLNDINYDKKCLVDDPEYEKAYPPFVVNRILSFSKECVFFAAEMNRWPNMPKSWQYKYLMNAIRKKKRYIKTHKVKENEEIEALKFLFKLTDREAKLYRDIICHEFGEFPKEYMEQTQTLRDKKGLITNDRKRST